MPFIYVYYDRFLVFVIGFTVIYTYVTYFLPTVVFICTIYLLVNYNHVNNMNDFMGKNTYGKKEMIKAIAEIFS